MTPARMLTTIVRVATTVPPAGNSTPSALKSALRPFARPSPSTSPRMDAMSPTTNASSITTLRTCRLEPPIVRSVANSRTRCAMVIESVLAMTKLPTNRAMNPKPSRNFCTTPVDLLMSSTAEVVLACEVFDLGRRREQRLDCRCELVRRDAFARRDLDLVELAQLVEQLLSRGQVEDRDRGSADRRNRCELCDARDRERANAVDRRDADAVSDGEVLRRRGVLVDRDLAVADGPLAGRERQRVEPLVSGGVDAVGDRRRRRHWR